MDEASLMVAMFAVLVAIFAGTVGMIWIAAKAVANQAVLRRDIERLTAAIERLTLRLTDAEGRIAVVEVHEDGKT